MTSKIKKRAKIAFLLAVNIAYIFTLVALICSIAACILIFSGIDYYGSANSKIFNPSNFRGSVWVSKELDAEIYVEKEKTVLEIATEDYNHAVTSCMHGSVKYNGEEYEFFVDTSLSYRLLTFVSTDIIDYYNDGGTEKYEEAIKDFTLFEISMRNCIRKRFTASFTDGKITSDYVEVRFYRVKK
ncbi:MAG: hypothetical protein J6Q68_04015 [Clostridia bacterium]|nr:hypothetical protein [Clostridia bacterium]